MKLVVTGANGFIGQNFIKQASMNSDLEIVSFSHNQPLQEFEKQIQNADWLIHLASDVSQKASASDVFSSNVYFTMHLLEIIDKCNPNINIMYASTVHATDLNPNLYGETKRILEDLLKAHQRLETGKTVIFRFDHLFGENAKINHNSAITTFIYNVIHAIPVHLINSDIEISLMDVADVVKKMLSEVSSPKESRISFPSLQPIYTMSLGEMLDSITRIHTYQVSDEWNQYKPTNEFESKLFRVYKYYYDIGQNK